MGGDAARVDHARRHALRDPVAIVLKASDAAGGRHEALRHTVREPGVVWCFAPGVDGGIATRLIDAEGFRWVHLNLSDRRSTRWLEGLADLTPELAAVMAARDNQPRFHAERGGRLALVVHDRERDFDPDAVGRIATLHVLLVGDLLVTGRYRPLRGGDALRARLETGTAPGDGAAGLALLLETLVDTLAGQQLDLATELLSVEESLTEDERGPDIADLIAIRRRSAQIHRLTGSLRAVLQRMDRDPVLTPAIVAVARTLMPRVAALDADIVAGQQQLRLLRDELDLQATQRTNQNVYLLSVLTALMAPATLVTGFFGMNTGGLPFVETQHGTLLASGAAIASGLGSYAMLRAMGLVGRRQR